MSEWRSQQPFAAESRFSQRVAHDGVCEDEFLQILGEPAESLQKRLFAAPEWLEELVSAISTVPSSNLLPLPGSSAAGRGIVFIEAVEPLIRRGRDRLRKGISALVQARADLPFDPETVEEVLYRNLPWQLAVRMN